MLTVTSATVSGPSQLPEYTSAIYVCSASDTIGNGTYWTQRQPNGSYSGGFYIPEGKTYDFTYDAGDEGHDTLEFMVTDGGVCCGGGGSCCGSCGSCGSCCGSGGSDSPYYTAPENITITDSPISFQPAVGTVSATEGASASVVLGTLIDPDPEGGDYPGSTVTWGDGSSSPVTFSGTNVDANGNPITQGSAFLVEASHTYTDEGSYTANVSLQDDGGQAASGQKTISVADATISASAQDPGAIVGQEFTSIIGTVTDQNPYASASDYSNSTIDWGDGSAASTPTFQPISNSPGSFNIIGTHTYSQYGTFNMVINVQDNGGSNATAGNTVYLPAPTINIGSVTLGVAETLEVPVSLSGNNAGNDALTIAGYDSSVVQVGWANGSVTDANGNADLLVTGVGIGTTDIVITDAFGASGQGKQVVAPDTMSISTNHLSVCSAGAGKQVTVSVSHPDGTPAVNTLLAENDQPDGDVQIDPGLIATDNNGSVVLTVKGLHAEQGEGVVVGLQEVGGGGAYGNFGVNIVPPVITIPSTINLPVQPDPNHPGQELPVPVAVTVTVTDPTSDGAPIAGVSLIDIINPLTDAQQAGNGGAVTTNANGQATIMIQAAVTFGVPNAAPNATATLIMQQTDGDQTESNTCTLTFNTVLA